VSYDQHADVRIRSPIAYRTKFPKRCRDPEEIEDGLVAAGRFGVSIAGCCLVASLDAVSNGAFGIAGRAEMARQLRGAVRTRMSYRLERPTHPPVQATAPMERDFTVERLLDKSVREGVPLAALIALSFDQSRRERRVQFIEQDLLILPFAGGKQQVHSELLADDAGEGEHLLRSRCEQRHSFTDHRPHAAGNLDRVDGRALVVHQQMPLQQRLEKFLREERIAACAVVHRLYELV
jgi:hypothetical protein